MATDARTSTPTIVAAVLVTVLVVVLAAVTPLGGWMLDTITTVFHAMVRWFVHAALTIRDIAVSIWHWIF